MPRWPVSHQDGIYQVADRDGLLYPITQLGEPVRTLAPGWYPVGLQTGLPPFHLLELRNDADGGQDAVWYLTEELEFVTHTAAHFSKEQIELAVDRISPLLRDIYDHGICAERPTVAPSSHAFDGVGAYAVRELIGVVAGTALPPPEMVQVDRLDLPGGQAAAGLKMSAGLIRHALDFAVPETPQDGARLASPFDASLLAAQDVYAPGGGALSQVYRFHDQAASAALYLLVWRDNRPALYIPTMNTIFSDAAGLSGADVVTALLCAYATRTARALSAPAEAEPQDAPAGAHVPPPSNWWRRMFGRRQG